MPCRRVLGSVATVDVAGVDLVPDILELVGVPIGDDDVCRPVGSSGSVATVDVAGVDLVTDALELVGVPVGDDDVSH